MRDPGKKNPPLTGGSGDLIRIQVGVSEEGVPNQDIPVGLFARPRITIVQGSLGEVRWRCNAAWISGPAHQINGAPIPCEAVGGRLNRISHQAAVNAVESSGLIEERSVVESTGCSKDAYPGPGLFGHRWPWASLDP